MKALTEADLDRVSAEHPSRTAYLPASRARAHFTRARLVELFDYRPETGVLILRSTGQEVSSVNNNGYLWIWVEGAALLAHRVAWRIVTGEWPEGMVDHVDGRKTNNAWSNLRATDHSRNAQNQHRAMRTSQTGVLGVMPGDKRSGKLYRAQIEVNGVKKSLGAFDTIEEAQAAYLKAKAEFHPAASITWSKS